MANYTPPPQSKLSQVFDVLVLLVLTVGALYIPLWLGLAGSDQFNLPVDTPTWETLNQNATMVEKWKELGYATPEEAAPLITARYDYSFSIVALIAVVITIVGYFTMMLKLSGIEYREVIAEKFGNE